jgi:2-methylfumaryl-CoA isomerase
VTGGDATADTAGILAGMRVVEGSAFVAVPLGGMTLAQLGADVIRFDQIGGGPDHGRWPLAPGGASLFWAGLNKGKRSLAVDLRSAEGRELVTALVTAGGDDAGLFLTNFPARGFLAYETLRARRRDLVMLVLTGNRDGTSALDYTVNAATGFPEATGPRGHDLPVNSLLPAWDVAAGGMAATGLLAAERHRRATGQGQLVELALADVALAAVGHLGRLAQAELGAGEQAKDGNHLYGAFGRDFGTRDGRRVMVVALTARQWEALRDVTGSAAACAALERSTGLDLATEAGRYAARDALAAIVEPWFAARDLAAVEAAFAGTGVCAGTYRTFAQLAAEDARVAPAAGLYGEVDQPGIGRIRAPASPLRFGATAQLPPLRAPRLGEHTEEVLATVLGLGATEIGRLHDAGVVACG